MRSEIQILLDDHVCGLLNFETPMIIEEMQVNAAKLATIIEGDLTRIP